MAHTYSTRHGTEFICNSDLTGTVEILCKTDQGIVRVELPCDDVVEFVVEAARQNILSGIDNMPWKEFAETFLRSAVNFAKNR